MCGAGCSNDLILNHGDLKWFYSNHNPSNAQCLQTAVTRCKLICSRHSVIIALQIFVIAWANHLPHTPTSYQMTGVDNELEEHKAALNDFHSKKKNKQQNISIHSALCFTVLHQKNVITGGAGSKVSRSEVIQGLVDPLLTPGTKRISSWRCKTTKLFTTPHILSIRTTIKRQISRSVLLFLLWMWAITSSALCRAVWIL